MASQIRRISALVGFHNLPPVTQHIYLHTCFAGGTATTALYSGITSYFLRASSPSPQHFTAAFPQLTERGPTTLGIGEPFSAFYACLKDLADEVDLCTKDHSTCVAVQLKMILSMGMYEEECVQRLVSLDTQASLDDIVTCCRTFESSRTTASAIFAAPSQVNVLSSYKRNHYCQ